MNLKDARQLSPKAKEALRYRMANAIEKGMSSHTESGYRVALKNGGMGRTITLKNHLSSEELKARYQSSHDPVESRRWHLLWLVSQQWYLLDAAESVGVSYSYARKVVMARQLY